MGRPLLIWCVLALIVGAWVVYGLITPGLKPVVISHFESAKLEATHTTINVGRVPLGETVTQTFHLYNTGGQPFWISAMACEFHCDVTPEAPLKMSPGEYLPVKITTEPLIVPGPFRYVVRLAGHDSRFKPMALYLKGSVVR